eukprot:GDKI01044812.1.p1 GENE.GDKI01044812.1~~GDKI01044812.1.p1  ORF type:complete len:551 (-),score=181.42 GDKI01044812.1:1570-3222(-)
MQLTIAYCAAFLLLLCSSVYAIDSMELLNILTFGNTQHSEEMTHRNAQQILKDNAYMLVMFYAPWCYWSRMMLPEFEAAAQRLKMHDPPVRLMLANGDGDPQLGRTYGISAYPTLKFFADGTAHEYTGGRSAAAIVQWVNRRTDKEHMLNSTTDFDTFVHEKSVVCVGVFLDKSTESARQVYTKASRHHDNVMFGVTESKEVADHIKATYKLEDVKSPSILLFSPHDTTVAVLSDATALSDDALIDVFVNKHRLPAVVPFNKQFVEDVFADGRPLCILLSSRPISHPPQPGERTAEETAFYDAAQSLRGTVLFVHADVNAAVQGDAESAGMVKRLMDMLGMESDEFANPPTPQATVRIATAHAQGTRNGWRPELKYVLSDAVTTASVTQFVLDFQANALKPYLKSEPVPEDDLNRGPVRNVVGSTFETEVKANDQDVIVTFYAPWCGHCRKFAPIFREAAKRLKYVSSVKFAQFDATRNELEGLHIPAYPTVLLFRAGSKNTPKEFNEERSADGIINWLQRHAARPFHPNPPAHTAQEEGEDTAFKLIEL